MSPNGETFDADNACRAFDRQPYFGLYKDNYFVFGPSIGQRPSRKKTNIKFQISIAQHHWLLNPLEEDGDRRPAAR